MSWAQWIWYKLRQAWKKSREVAAAAARIERATNAYINSREYQEARG